MKNAWWNPEYIVDLTESIFRKTVLESLRTRLERVDINHLHRFLAPIIEITVEKMRSETLGRICAYGNQEGIHSHGSLAGAGFINKTGFADLGHKSYRGATGRQLLESIAIDTLVCIAIDIILQVDYKLEQSQEEQEGHEIERAEHTMAHVSSIKDAKYMGSSD